MAYDIDFYKWLPLFPRLVDEQYGEGLLSHISNAITTQYSDMLRHVGDSELYYNVAITPSEWLDAWQQYVQAGWLYKEDGRRQWLGLGVDPHWPAEHKRIFIRRFWQYLQIKGTDLGVRESIYLWLRYEDTVHFDRAWDVKPNWSDYKTPYDRPWQLPFRQIPKLGSGDYEDTPHHPRWQKLKTQYKDNWSYQRFWNKDLAIERAPRKISDGSYLGPQRVVKHFEATPDTWNLVFPNIHALDLETTPALEKHRNFGWLTFNENSQIDFGLKLKPRDDLVEYIDRLQWEPKGYKFINPYPLPYVKQTTETEETQIALTYHNWHNKVEWGEYCYPNLTPRSVAIESRKTIRREIIPRTPFDFIVGWGDIAAEDRYEGQPGVRLLRVFDRGHPGCQWSRDLYPAQWTETTTTTVETTLPGTYQFSANWLSRWQQQSSWYFPATTSSTEQVVASEVKQTGIPSYYAPARWRYLPATTEGTPLSTPRANILPKPWPVRIPQKTTRQIITQPVDSNYLSCWQWQGTSDLPRVEETPTPAHVFIAGIYPGAQWGDSREQIIYNKEYETLAGDLRYSAAWNQNYNRLWYVPPTIVTKISTRVQAPYKTRRDIESAAWGATEKTILHHWQSYGVLQAVDYLTPYTKMPSWYSPPQKTTEVVAVTPITGTTPFYAPSYFKTVVSTPIPLPSTHRRYIATPWGRISTWYRPRYEITRSLVALTPSFTFTAHPFYRNQVERQYLEINTELPTTYPLVPARKQWVAYKDKVETQFTQIPIPFERLYKLGYRSRIVEREQQEVTNIYPGQILDFSYIPTTTQTTTETRQKSGVWPGVRWQTSSWVSLSEIVVGTQTEIVPSLPPDENAALVDFISGTREETVIQERWHGNGFGFQWGNSWHSSASARLASIEITLPSIDISDLEKIQPLDSIDVSEIFAENALGGMSLRPSAYWYFPTRLQQEIEVIETPNQYHWLKRKVATYRDRYNYSYAYLHAPFPGRDEIARETPVYGQPLVQREQFFYAPEIYQQSSKTEIIPEQFKGKNLKVASYRGFWSRQYPYYRARAQNITSIQWVETSNREVVWCNLPDIYTNYDILWLEVSRVRNVIEVSSRNEAYPRWRSIRNSQSWRIMLEMPDGVVTDRPKTLLWTNGIQYQQNYDPDNNFSNLYLEFVVAIRPEQVSRIKSVCLLIDNEYFFSKHFVINLNLHQKTYCGFRFSIPVSFETSEAFST